MTPMDLDERVNIEMSKMQREVFDTPFHRRVLMLMNAGYTEEQAEAFLMEKENQRELERDEEALPFSRR